MKKILVALVMLTSGTPVLAQGYHYRPYGYTPAPHYRHHHHNHGGGNWVAPLVGGIVGGAVLGAIIAPNIYAPAPEPICTDRLVGYDVYGRAVVERFCR
jgi:hypothetical protein